MTMELLLDVGDRHASVTKQEADRIGILNDYVSVPYANGSSFASQFLYREFRARGHEVTIVGPQSPFARPEDLPERNVSLTSLPLRNHPGVYLSLPTRRALNELVRARLSVVLGQTGSALMEAGVWLRNSQAVPFLCVNTIHLPSVYNVLLPDGLCDTKVNRVFQDRVVPFIEQQSVRVYNQSDGLVVLSKGLERYWRERGVKVPIFVIPRAVDPAVFDRSDAVDPFPPGAKRGTRLLSVCRMTREKGVSTLLEIFAKIVARASREATLTLVGDGPDYDTFRSQARRLGVEGRVFFAGERVLTEIPAFMRHADVFVYTSLSETYGQVISEAQWCGLPVVAFADDMGVSQQVEGGRTGCLVDPRRDGASFRFAKSVLRLLHDPAERQALAKCARGEVEERSDPSRCIERYYEAFAAAREHLSRTMPSAKAIPRVTTDALARWTSVHLAAAALGLVRPPAIVNRNGCRQPSWDRPLTGTPASRRSAATLRGGGPDDLQEGAKTG
jgi:glycosyltransferase involved in cell wall biosynthesis